MFTNKKKTSEINNTLQKQGYCKIKNFFSASEKKKLLKFANIYSYKLVSKWNIDNYKINNQNFFKNIIKFYLLNNRPNYRRDPNKNFANEDFFKVININKFKNFHKHLKCKNWYFSFIKNLRFKSKVLPWSISKWHCDRFTFDCFKYPEFKFLIFWFPLQRVDNETGGGLEIVPKNIFSFSNLSDNELKKKKSDLFYFDKYKNKFKNRTIIPKLNFGDLLVLDSKTIHRTNAVYTENPVWSYDFRFEYGQHISSMTKKGGFNMHLKKKTKLKKLIKSSKLKFKV